VVQPLAPYASIPRLLHIRHGTAGHEQRKEKGASRHSIQHKSLQKGWAADKLVRRIHHCCRARALKRLTAVSMAAQWLTHICRSFTTPAQHTSAVASASPPSRHEEQSPQQHPTAQSDPTACKRGLVRKIYITLCPPGCCRFCILDSSVAMPAAMPKLRVRAKVSCLMSP
jgi:hypothetical protein